MLHSISTARFRPTKKKARLRRAKKGYITWDWAKKKDTLLGFHVAQKTDTLLGFTHNKKDTLRGISL